MTAVALLPVPPFSTQSSEWDTEHRIQSISTHLGSRRNPLVTKDPAASEAGDDEVPLTSAGDGSSRS